MKIFLVRHGETQWNKLGKFQGQVDVALNQRGLAQARDAARAALAWRPAALYSSPLRRTMQVAEEVSRKVGLPVTVDPRLMELNLGELEGATSQQMREEWPQVYRSWRENPGETVMPGGESMVQLRERVWQSFLGVEETHSEDEAVLMVSHNFAIRCIISQLLGIPWSHYHGTYLDLGSVCIIETTRDATGETPKAATGDATGETGNFRRRLKSYNSVSHLSPENQPSGSG